jgi:hypothetical protein
MTHAWKILMLEDSPADFLLALRQLRETLPELEARRVDGMVAFRAALVAGGWDAILSDYSLPGMAFGDVAAMAGQLAPDVPLLVFSGGIGEEQAVALLRQGVRDFVLKDRPRRLASAVQNAVQEATAAKAQREAVAALLASEALLRSIMHSIDSGLVVLDTGGRILLVNGAWTRLAGACGLPGAGQGSGVGFAGCLREGLAAPLAEQILAGLAAIQAGKTARFDLDYACAGTWIRLNALPLMGAARDGPARTGHQGLVLSFTDITAQQQAGVALGAAQDKELEMERELNHLQRLESIGRLAGGISHDMNNVLAAVMALATVLAVRFEHLPEVASGAGAILNAASRGRDLVKGLTDFARKGVTDAAPMDLNSLVRQEADLMERTTFRKVAIQLDLQEPLPEIQGEPHALANALMNLCVNACDAMPDGGVLRLETRLLPGGATVEVVVQDNGEGMPPEVAARAMEPFFTTKPAGKGTGLGLAIVYGTVKSHGGTLSITSHPGAGTRVALRFPALTTQNLGPAPAPEPVAEPAPRWRILLVDDEAQIRETVPALLEDLGHQVRVAAGGQEALGLLAGDPDLDAVILDLNMPELGGLATLARLRTLRPELPVLVSSGYRDPAAMAVIRGFPRVGILDKPFLAEDLHRALAALAALAGAGRNAEASLEACPPVLAKSRYT